jgi:signal transduction histidine kinase
MKLDTIQSAIMIVDDEPENLNVLGEMLREAGWSVRAFPRGEMALAAARDEPPALVLLDIRMPDMDGYEVCRRFKADERLSQIPVLFISALSDVSDITAGFACGGVDYITKPFREAEVLARVHTHLALRAAYIKLKQEHAHLCVLERQRDGLTHMLVHDMRGPLQVIGGHLWLIGANSPGGLPAEVHESLQAAIQGTRLLSQMVSTVMDVSRMESESIPLNLVSVPVGQLFLGARVQVHHPLLSHGLVEHIAESCPLVRCDLELSTRIVANLLSNAFKYSPDGREIELGAVPDPGGVRVWVRDQGVGIPPEYHERIFEKFGVVDSGLSMQVQSTGLGLAFCRLAVEAQGGAIGVESEPGQGSTFWFTLPGVS